MRRVLVLVMLVLVASAGATLWGRYGADRPPPAIADETEHFKYGSIGAEVGGYPYLIWRELPALFPDKLPKGWAGFGFVQEPGRPLPVGVSVRRYVVDRVGFNCAACHATTIDGVPGVVLGAPAVKLELQRYLTFLVEASQDPRLTADAVFASAEAAGRPFDWIDRLAFRYVVFGLLRSEIEATAKGFAWMASRAPHGPGRTDAGNVWRSRWGMKPEDDRQTGVVDFPSLWNQRLRADVWMHWDGNNRSLDERNLSAALAGGASPDSLDHDSIRRVARWSMDLPPPRFPQPIDAALRARGAAVYAAEGCGVCHDPGGARFGEATPKGEVGTDPARVDLFSAEMVRRFGDVGEGKPWRFRNYRVSPGYANAPLDGIWARAPYLHNGSVPTLDALLRPVAERPTRFFRGCGVLDPVAVGYACGDGHPFDVALPGNGNGGHLYGAALPDDDRRALIEFLKSL